MLSMWAVVIVIVLLAIFLQKRKSDGGHPGDELKEEVEDVPQGLEIYDENGNVVISTAHRLCRVFGRKDINSLSGEILHKDIEPGKTWYYITLQKPKEASKDVSIPPILTVSKGKISWSYDKDSISYMRRNKKGEKPVRATVWYGGY